jgi:hypothetical protein
MATMSIDKNVFVRYISLRESGEAMITTIHNKIDLLLVPASFMPASGRSPKQSPFWGELPFHLGPRLPFAPRCCPLSLAC